tara:strand:+ start:9067 stop:9441 length:375 start_codon:yes stop_codon:yes gene_type:complete
MQTVYLLKDCYKSYIALKKLYSFPSLSTTIIIIDKKQANILLLDKRVKKFPFIINTLPTSIGLIPKLAKVLPLEMFMMLRKFKNGNKNYYKGTKMKTNKINQNKRPPLIKTIKEKDGGVNIILN